MSLRITKYNLDLDVSFLNARKTGRSHAHLRAAFLNIRIMSIPDLRVSRILFDA
jgi:hypothetical protein